MNDGQNTAKQVGAEKKLNISTKSFLTAIAVIFGLMLATYILTLFIPGGSYNRIDDGNGNLIIDTAGGFTQVEGGIPFWKWLLSPFLVLGASGNGTLIAIIAFLLVIGGIFTCLDACGLMKYMLNKIVKRFAKTRYLLLTIIMLFFMLMGSMIGSFEECVPMVPIVVALTVTLGWDSTTGLFASILAAGCGFAAGVCNPFTVGVAQGLAGLPMFSGVWLRLASFVLIFALLFTFTFLRAKKIEKPLSELQLNVEFDTSKRKDLALLLFALIIGVGIVVVLCSSFITVLQDYSMIIIAVMFLVAGIVSCLVFGMKLKSMLISFLKGVLSMLPAVVMILMASSIKYTLEEAKILDTILHSAVGIAGTLPKWSVILFIYLIVLIMNFFIASGSAKAFMLIPIIMPLAEIFQISPQLCIVAFAFGDGFSNVMYPTNPVLLISLGLADVSYGKWFKKSILFQICNILLTSGILLLGLAVGY